jgi:hypothetical protein
MARWGLVLDASTSRVTREDFRRLREIGVAGFIQCLQTGGFSASQAQVRAVAAANLGDAIAEGLPVGGYTNSQPWREVEIIIGDTIEVAGPYWDACGMVANDIEIDGITEAQCLRTTQALEADGKRVPHYTAWWFAQKYGGMRWGWMAEGNRGGWDADYDGRPELEAVRWGPPGMPVRGKQYAGTTNLGGDLFDLNFFDLDYLTGATPKEDEMPKPVKFEGSPDVWLPCGGFLSLVPSVAVLRAMGFQDADVQTRPTNDPLNELPKLLTYHDGKDITATDETLRKAIKEHAESPHAGGDFAARIHTHEVTGRAQ